MRKLQDFRLYILVTVTISILFVGCASSSFEEAQKFNTVKAYDKFLKEYPTDKEYSSKAKELREKVFFENVENENTLESYDSYFKEYSNGKFTYEAERLRDKKVFENVKKKNTFESYHKYLIENKNGKYRADAINGKIALEFKKVEDLNTIKDYVNFIENYPKSNFTTIAEKKLHLKLNEHNLNEYMFIVKKHSSFNITEKVKVIDIYAKGIVVNKNGKFMKVPFEFIEKERSVFKLNIKTDKNVKIKIDNKLSKSTILLKKGKHTLELTKKGYMTILKTFNISSDTTQYYTLENVINGNIYDLNISFLEFEEILKNINITDISTIPTHKVIKKIVNKLTNNKINLTDKEKNNYSIQAVKIVLAYMKHINTIYNIKESGGDSNYLSIVSIVEKNNKIYITIKIKNPPVRCFLQTSGEVAFTLNNKLFNYFIYNNKVYHYNKYNNNEITFNKGKATYVFDKPTSKILII